MGKRWTGEEDDTLRTMRKAGVSYKECAKVLNRSEHACSQRGFTLGLVKKRSESLPIDLPVYTADATEVPDDFGYLMDVQPTWWRRALRRFTGG